MEASHPICRETSNYSLEEFMEFLQRKQVSAKITYTISGKDLESMVLELVDAKVVEVVRGDRIKPSYGYYIGEKRVMAKFDSRGWETIIHSEYKDLIMNKYQEFRGPKYNVKEDATTITKSINVKYAS